jgi:hypothetical protein
MNCIKPNGSKYRIAFLNNHNSAAAFLASVCFDAGIEFYMPLICPEKGSLRHGDAKSLRSISIAPEHELALDEINLYEENSDLTTEYINLLSRCFDLIIIPGATRHRKLVSIASRADTKVLIYEWGDLLGISLHQEYKEALKRPNVSLAVQFRDQHPTAVCLPLGFNEAIYGCKRQAKHDTPSAAIVLSRLHASYPRAVFDRVMSRIRGAQYDLHIFGKDHGSGDFCGKYRSRWRSVTLRPDLELCQLYESLSKFYCLIYPIEEMAMCQYLPFEAIFLGTPVIYSSKTLFSSMLPSNDACRVSSFDDISNILQSLLIPGVTQLAALNQNIALKEILTAKSKWRDLFCSTFDGMQ